MSGFVCLLSGGQDSCTALFWALRELGGPAYGLTANYNQVHWQEGAAARRVAAVAKAEVISATLGAQGMGLPSALVHGETSGSYIVPGRNTMLLTVATAAAVGRGLTDVVFGGCLEDAEGFPDCRPAFVEAAQDCMRLAFAEPRLTIHAPLLKLTKVETVSLARELGDDCWRALGKTWSCYAPVRGANNSRDWVRCGECPACIKRARGFAAAGEKDPAPREMKA